MDRSVCFQYLLVVLCPMTDELIPHFCQTIGLMLMILEMYQTACLFCLAHYWIFLGPLTDESIHHFCRTIGSIPLSRGIHWMGHWSCLENSTIFSGHGIGPIRCYFWVTFALIQFGLVFGLQGCRSYRMWALSWNDLEIGLVSCHFWLMTVTSILSRLLIGLMG